MKKFYIYLLLFFLYSNLGYGQAADCVNANNICPSESQTYTPTDGAVDDYDDPDNDNGCLSSGEQESMWFTLSFDDTMPPNSNIAVVINPNGSDDYDFAFYGPDVDCDNLGSPIRCSYAAGIGNTGLQDGAGDLTEGAAGDEFVEDLIVQPGEVYTLIVSNFSESGNGFEFNWSGTAVPYLDCPCDLDLTSGPAYIVCPGEPSFPIWGIATGTTGGETFTWTATNGGMAYLDNPNSSSTNVTLPPSFQGEIMYTLTVANAECSQSVDIPILVLPGAMPNSGSEEFCEGESVTLDAGSGFNSYTWSNNQTTSSITVSTPGTYTVTVIDGSGCPGEGTFTVTQNPAPTVDIFGDVTICQGGSTQLFATSGFSNYQWSTNQSGDNIVVDAPGTYSVTVTDNNGCEADASFTVTQFPVPTVDIFGNLTVCAGGSTQLFATPGFSNYQWSTNQGGDNIIVNTPGAYSVTVTDFNGCDAEATVNVIDLGSGNITIDPSSLLICQNGTVLLDAGAGFDSYQWSGGNNPTGQENTVVSPGTYSVTVTDNGGCVSEGSVTIGPAPPVMPSIIGELSICGGQTTVLDAGSGYDSYQWSGGNNPTSQQNTITSPGTYSVTVTDANGCEGETSVTVMPSSPIDVQINGDQEMCEGGESILVVNGNYDSYQWSGGNNPTSQQNTITGPGTYSVTVTDANGCEGEASITVMPSSSIGVQINGDQEMCENGESILVVNGNYAAYQWSGGNNPTSQQNTITSPGTYSVTVTAADGCQGEASITIMPLPPLMPEIIGDLEICAEGETILSVNGNYASYQWSGGNNPTSQQNTVTSPGTYSVTVTDASGCTGETSVTVNLLPAPTPSIEGNLDVCANVETVLSVNGNYASYQWSGGNNPTSQQNTISSPGTYSVTVTDTNGCVGETSVTVNLLPPLVPTISGELTYCAGETTVVMVNENYDSYQWSGGNNPTSQQNTISTAGTYEVTVTNNDGCVGVASATIVEHPAPQPTIAGNLEICPGISTDLVVIGNYASYQWSAGSNTVAQTNTVTTAGVYEVTVTDFNGCEGTTSVTVTESQIAPPQILGELTICSGESTDLIVVGDYSTYQWSGGQNPNASFNTITTPGTYTLTVTDFLGCTSENTVTINETTIPPPTIDGNTVICEGEVASLSVNDIYSTYQWSGGATPNAATNIITAQGDYSVTVTADNGCQAVAETFVSVLDLPPPIITGDLYVCEGETTMLSLVNPGNYDQIEWSTGSSGDEVTISSAQTVEVTVTNNTGCTSSATAYVAEISAIDLQIQGATTACEGNAITLSTAINYDTYLWSDNTTNSILNVAETGTYTLTVTNEWGCQATDEIDITIFDNPMVEITGSTSFCIGGATTLSSNATFTNYEWTGGGSAASLEVTTSGTYSLTVTDENGCQATDEIVVTEQTELSPIISGPDSFCTGDVITLDVGNDFETYDWSPSGNTSTLEVTQGGAYSVTVTDAYGCSGETTVAIIENDLPIVEITGDFDFCTNDSTTINAGNYETYIWSNNTTTASTTITAPGDYEVTVTDNNGCVGEGSVSITEQPLPMPSIIGNTEFCPNTSTTIEVEQPYAAYEWSTAASSNQIEVTTVGDYMVTVTDSNGCQAVASSSIGEYMTTNPSLQGDATICPEGMTTLSAANTFVAYQWSDLSTAPTLEVDEAGAYGLTVTDNNGCVTNGVFEVAEYDVQLPIIEGVDGFCTNDNAVLSVAQDFATYTWSTSDNTPTTIVDAGGSYAVTVTDANNCTTENSFFIAEHPLPDVNIAGSYSYCIGNFTTLSAGNTYASYMWSMGSTEASIQVNTPGDVSLDVIDEFGCAGSTTINITEDTELSPVIAGTPEFCMGSPTTIDAGEGYANYTWSTSESNQQIEVSSAGTYSVTVTDASGCIGQGEIEVLERPLPEPVIQGEASFCNGDNITLAVADDFTSYAWSTDDNQPALTISTGGSYEITVTNEFNCTQSTAIEVTEHPLPIFELLGQNFFCEGEQTTISVSNTYQEYAWSNAASTPTVVIDQAGAINVEVTDENGCQATQEIIIDAIDNPIANAGDNQFFDCDTHTAIIGTLPATTNNNWTCEWSGTGITNENMNQWQPTVSSVGEYQLVIQDTVHNCVSNTASVTIEDLSYEPIVALQVHNTLDCLTDYVIVDGQNSSLGNDIIYQWYNQNGELLDSGQNLEYVANTPQIYILEVLDTLTSCVAQDSIEVLEDTAYPIAIAGLPAHLDCNITSAVLNGTGSYEGDNITYQWTASQGGNIISGDTTLFPIINQPGSYQILVTDVENGCSNVDTVLVTQDIQPPFVDAGQDQTLDCLTESVVVNGSNSQAGSNITIEWQLVGNTDVVSTQWSFSTEEAGSYLLTLTNIDNGCNNTDIVEVLLDDNYLLGFESTIQDESCFAQVDGAITIPQVEGGTPPFLYSIDNEAFSTNNQFSNLAPGEYQITIQDVVGCEWTDTLTVQGGNDVQVDLGEDIFIDVGESTSIHALTNLTESQIGTVVLQSQDSIFCQNINCLEFLTSPLITTNYSVTIVDENGCAVSEEITVYVNHPGEIYVPTAFSPNGDGTNDIFMIFSRNDVEKIHAFEVFNRWGEHVFEIFDFPPNEAAYGWNGTHKGKELNPAVFVWYAEVEFINGDIKIFSGDVTLIK